MSEVLDRLKVFAAGIDEPGMKFWARECTSDEAVYLSLVGRKGEAWTSYYAEEAERFPPEELWTEIARKIKYAVRGPVG